MPKYKVVNGRYYEVKEPRCRIYFRHEYGWDNVLKCWHFQLVNMGLDIQHNQIVLYYGFLGLCFIITIRRGNRR